MNKLFVKSRRSGQYHASVVEVSDVLEKGGTVGMILHKENNAAEKMAKAIKSYSGIDVDITRQTRIDPQDNRRMIFDRFGEVIGVEVIQQVEKFSGWKLSPTKIPANQKKK